MADNSVEVKAVEQPAKAKVAPVTTRVLNETEQRIEAAKDKANWEWVTVPEHDLFGKANEGVSVNFEKFGPGKHFVNPLLAEQIRTLVEGALRAEMRIMQPQTDPRYNEIMKKMGRTPAVNPNF